MEQQTGAATGPQTTETVSAERAAADRGDVSAFLGASRDRRGGKPQTPVTREKATTEAAAGAAKVAGRDGQAAKGPSDKDREADERLTARIREAVDTSTQDLRRKNEDLEREMATLRGRATPAGERGADGGPKPETPKRAALAGPDIKKYQALPDAPKLEDKDDAGNYLYETPSQHAIAMAEFIREKRAEEQATADRTVAGRVERIKREAARVTTFAERVQGFKDKHADVLVDNGTGAKISLPLSKDVAGLHGYAKLAELNEARRAAGQAEMPATADHGIAEEIYDSEIPGHVALFLSQHPEELQTLRGATSPGQLSKLFGRLESKVLAADASAAAVLSSGSATKPAAGAGAAKPATTTKPAADVRREAQDAVDRSVSSARPLHGNLGAPGAGSGGDPESAAIKSADYGAFAEIQRQRRVDELERRRGR